MKLDPRAAQTMHCYLAAMDEALPGFVTEAYVVGSAVQDDFRPGLSDVNFAAVVEGFSSAATRARVAEVHRRLAEENPACLLDGAYLERFELAANEPVPRGPCVRFGAFDADGPRGRTALAWKALVECGEPVRGDGLRGAPTWLTAKTVDRAVMAQAQAAAGQVPCETSRARPNALSSYVLGIARLHFTLATATLTSKTKAGLYGIVTFDGEWTPIIDAALRVRRDPLSATSDLSYDRAMEFIRMVVHDMEGLASVA